MKRKTSVIGVIMGSSSVGYETVFFCGDQDGIGLATSACWVLRSATVLLRLLTSKALHCAKGGFCGREELA